MAIAKILARAFPLVLLTLVLASRALAAPAQEPPAAAGLGEVHFPVSCSGPAQLAFDHAMALLHHMTYPKARAAFQDVAELDPGCAMARWGIAGPCRAGFI